MKLTHDRLLELLSYDPDTGIFVWIKARRGTRAGSIAGSKMPAGYIQIRIDQDSYYAHRLAIFYVTKTMPENIVDHIDGSKSNNKFSNLRCVTQCENQQNRTKANRRVGGRSSKYLGVSWKADHNKWAANIKPARGKMKFLGYFETEEAAHNAYLIEKRNIHEGNTL